MLQGIAVSSGIGLGTVLILREHTLVFDENRQIDPEPEMSRFSRAVKVFCDNTASRMRHLQLSTSLEDSRILETHINIANDPEMTREVSGLILSGSSAETALSKVSGQYIAAFMDSHD